MIPEHMKGPKENFIPIRKRGVVAVSLTSLIVVTMRQLYALICKGIG
jgi:hypothetical protein